MGATGGNARRYGRRSVAVAAVPAALIACALGIAGAFGIMALVASTNSSHPHSSYCPFYVSSGIEFPTPGHNGNTSPNATNFFANGSVIFTSGASGCVPPYVFTWNFGDGTLSHLQDLTHVYPGPGYYPGTLTVNDSAGHQEITYLCIDASAWPALTGGSGNPAPACP